MAKKNNFNITLNPDINYIAVDILGGDDGAEDRNLDALHIVLQDFTGLMRDKVGFVLVGDRSKIEQEVKDALFLVGEGEVDQLSNYNIKIVHANKQAPMNGGGREKDNSMGVIAQLQKDYSKIVATYSNGSTKHNVGLSVGALGREKDEKTNKKKKPVIIKEFLEGRFVADIGAFINTSLQDYIDTLKTLKAHNDVDKTMILPSDEFTDFSIKKSLGCDGNYIEFDALAFLQSKLNLVGDGFIGNMYLKIVEAFIKDKKGQNLSEKGLREIRERILKLEKDEETGNWKIPDGINMNGVSCGILCNGTEDKKGTSALQKFKASLEDDKTFKGELKGFVEPESLINDSTLCILTTPACAKLVNSITQPSILQKKWNPFKWKQLIKLKKEARETAPIAEIEHLESGRAFVGHGDAKTKATTQNLDYLLDVFAQEA